MKKPRLYPLFFAMIAALSITSGALAQSESNAASVSSAPNVQATPVGEKPLLIIRFNAPNVYYQNSLILAVSKAKEVNPNARFTLVSYVPYGPNPTESARMSDRANTKLNAIVEQMRQLGVPSSQMTLDAEASEKVASQEVHLFVN